MMSIEDVKEKYPGNWEMHPTSNHVFNIRWANGIFLNMDWNGFYYYGLDTPIIIIQGDDVNRFIQKQNALVNFT